MIMELESIRERIDREYPDLPTDTLDEWAHRAAGGRLLNRIRHIDDQSALDPGLRAVAKEIRFAMACPLSRDVRAWPDMLRDLSARLDAVGASNA